MTSQLSSTMATITTITIKQYEFCDEIKQHILSYITRKPFDLEKNWKFVYSFRTRQPTLKTLIYRFRLRMSRRQLLYELSDAGLKRQLKVAQAINLPIIRREVIRELNYFWTQHFGPYTKTSFWDKKWIFKTHYSRMLYEPYRDELTLNFRGANFSKAMFLVSIRYFGNLSTKRIYKKMRKSERVNCELCGKDLARCSLNNHMKKIHWKPF